MEARVAKEPPLREALCVAAWLLEEGAVFGFDLGFLGGDDDGGGDFVLVFEVEQLDALGGAAGGADGLGVDADDLAVLADDHELGGLVDQEDGVDLAVAGGGLDVDDALAAAGLQAVLVDISALAEAVGGDGEDQAGAVLATFVLALPCG